MTRLSELLRHGQSPWLDYIRRSLLTTGQLKQMVDRDGITGVTSNPTIFDKAISGSSDYDASLGALLRAEPGLTSAQLYERLAVQDVTMAADVLRSVYDRTGGVDGYVSLEVAPGLLTTRPGRSRRPAGCGPRSVARTCSSRSPRRPRGSPRSSSSPRKGSTSTSR